MALRMQEQVALADYTTLQVGGPADYLVRVETVEELQEAQIFSQKKSAPLTVIGGGSNLLARDAGYRGVVVVNAIKGIQDLVHGDCVYLKVGAGEVFDDLVAYSVKHNYWGLENLSAIPGSVGATPIQNVGAYGAEVSSCITEVKAVHKLTNEVKTFSTKECQFDYRDSFFKTAEGRQWSIVEVVFKLSMQRKPNLEYGALAELKEVPKVSLASIRDKVIAIRSGKFPDWTAVGTAGSFFKNPIVPVQQFEELQATYPDLPGYPVDDAYVKVPLGWVLDTVCGLKGYCENGVCLYEHQALVLVNYEAKQADAIEQFADHVAEVVKDKTGITIEREVTTLG
jgi:UDP-N-acetylmuramate dehydrogenase